MERNTDIDTNGETKQLITCKCPQCERIYQRSMFWSGGNVMPRMRCHQCEHLRPLFKDYEVDDPTWSFNPPNRKGRQQ